MRLIDADAVINNIMEKWGGDPKYYVTDDDKTVSLAAYVDEKCLEQINKMPTIEAEPVKHGMWQFQYEDITTEETLYECSECGGVYPRYNFCPRCGAMMDGKDEDK